jgi:glycosyltransferase involved in cell wall biosynthesis
MEKCMISIIIPCYYQAQYLEEAVNSVISQTYDYWECIIVDDGSPDDTEEVYTKNWPDDIRIKYLKKENGGLSDARNAGIAIANGKYILPLDADDKIGREYLADAVVVLEKNDDIKIVYADAEFFGGKSGKWELEEFNLDKFLLYNQIYCSALFRKSDYEKTVGYNKNMKYGFEDWDFWLSIIETGGQVYKIPKTLFYYRVKDQSMVSQLSDDKKNLLRRRIYANHTELYAKLFHDPLTLYEENQNLKKKVKRLEKSKYYRLGYFLLVPFKFIHGLIQKLRI